MAIQLSENFNLKKLLIFTFPSIIMMIFTSIYSIVDGLFVSNFVGKEAFTAINIVFPIFMVIGALGFMIGTGGSALVSKTLGEGNKQKAREIFSMLVYSGIIGGIILSILGIFFLKPLSILLGAKGDLLKYCMIYGILISIALPGFILQNIFQSFLVTAERPKFGLYITIIAGVTNIILDALFIIVFKWGIAGAAIATAIGQTIGGLVPFLYFLRPYNEVLYLVKFKFNLKVLMETCYNGSSELLTNISASIITIFYNLQLLKLIGIDGVAAYGSIMYISFIFMAIFFGFSIGSASIIGYHYGAQNYNELKSLLKNSVKFVVTVGFFLTVFSILFSDYLSNLFVGYDRNLFEITKNGLIIFSFSFILSGINIFASSFFTALNDGFVSAVISFFRTFVFQILTIFTLPLIFGLNGAWFSMVIVEILSLIVVIYFTIKNKDKYHYL